MDNFTIDLADGKYTVLHKAGKQFEALRYGEKWRDLSGDKLIYSLCCKILELEEENKRWRKQITPLTDKIKVMLHRHKEPELGLDCSKGLTLVFWYDGRRLHELRYEGNEE